MSCAGTFDQSAWCRSWQNVNRVRVVGAVPLDRYRPVIRGPDYVDTGVAGTGGPSTETGEQINCCCHVEFSIFRWEDLTRGI